MNRENKYVIKPLVKWFKSQKASWEIKTPRFPTAAIGWDLEARRKHQDLLIEAKYINGPFLNSFSGLVSSTLANRPQSFMKRKYRSWNVGVCWAIGTSYSSRNVYQILFDYLARNLKFWEFYGQYFSMKYVFFVDKGLVKKLPWKKLMRLASKYTTALQNRKLKRDERRKLASTLFS